MRDIAKCMNFSHLTDSQNGTILAGHIVLLILRYLAGFEMYFFDSIFEIRCSFRVVIPNFGRFEIIDVVPKVWNKNRRPCVPLLVRMWRCTDSVRITSSSVHMFSMQYRKWRILSINLLTNLKIWLPIRHDVFCCLHN